jgi:hypothetical protein
MHASPNFPEVQKKLNDNHLVAFIVAIRDIEAGEECLWKYDISQGYRHSEAPPTPSPVTTMPSDLRGIGGGVCRNRSNFSSSLKSSEKSGQPAADTMRCAGCKCINHCPSLKNCLTVQILPTNRRAVVKENVSSKQLRVEGCLCINPCSSVKHCLTPQQGLGDRIKAARRLLE